MPEVRYIAPESETMADRLDAMRVLAMTAEAAEAEYSAIWDEDLSDDYFLDQYGHSTTSQDHAVDRSTYAREALSLEVEDAEREGLMHELSHLARTEMGL